MKALFRILGTAAAVAATGAAIVVLDKILNDKGPLHVESVEFPEEAENDPAEAEKTAEAYAEGEAKAAAPAQPETPASAASSATPAAEETPAEPAAAKATVPRRPSQMVSTMLNRKCAKSEKATGTVIRTNTVWIAPSVRRTLDLAIPPTSTPSFLACPSFESTTPLMQPPKRQKKRQTMGRTRIRARHRLLTRFNPFKRFPAACLSLPSAPNPNRPPCPPSPPSAHQ